MQQNFFQLEQSGWWVLLIIFLSAALTWLLYSQTKKPWNHWQNLILSTLRFGGVFLILFLLLEPLIKQVIGQIEKPTITIAIDNSRSVPAHGTDSALLKMQINQLEKELENEGFEVVKFFHNETDSFDFDQNTTDLFSLLKKGDDYMEGRNWSASILFTDGIYNQGSSPLYRPFLVPHFVVGLGDTIPPKDINISRVRYNQVSYKGNETPILVEISQKGFDGKSTTLYLTEGGNVVAQQRVKLDKSIQEVTFTTKSEVEGIRKFLVSIPLEDDEFIKENNSADVFMEVIDGKQKVLIVANAPHPDIKAIRSTLSSSDNYQTDIFIPSLDSERPNDIYDVVIYHGAFTNRINYEPKENPGRWYILNNASSLRTVNQDLSFVNIRKRGSQPDKVTGAFNQGFSKFKIPENNRLIESLPPIQVPFGEYGISSNAEVLLYQRIGNVVTKKPLFTFFDDGSQKIALLMGQDFWKWKLQEAAIEGSSTQFDQIISKTVQFLSVKNDKKQFRFRTRENRFSNISPPVFDSEVYNDIYERTYGNTISLSIFGENGNENNYEFIDSEFKSNFRIPPLAAGLYSYQASTQVGDKRLVDQGQFVIETINREYLNLAADHNLLRNIATKTDGTYFHSTAIKSLIQEIRDRDFKSIVSKSESHFPLMESPWILLIILLLFSTEWLLRKYWGGY